MPPADGGFRDEAERLRAIEARRANLRPILTVLAEDLRTLVDDCFAGSHAPDGTPWVPLADSTLEGRGRSAAGPSRTASGKRRAWTRRRSERASATVFNAKPLIDTGRLRSSIAIRVTANQIFIGSNLVYAAAQQFGEGDIPARPYLPFTSAGGDVEFMNSGAAAAWLTRVQSAVTAYVETGAIT